LAILKNIYPHAMTKKSCSNTAGTLEAEKLEMFQVTTISTSMALAASLVTASSKSVMGLCNAALMISSFIPNSQR
jgi:hypothetical protein